MMIVQFILGTMALLSLWSALGGRNNHDKWTFYIGCGNAVVLLLVMLALLEVY